MDAIPWTWHLQLNLQKQLARYATFDADICAEGSVGLPPARVLAFPAQP
jgi:hypothetical protein